MILLARVAGFTVNASGDVVTPDGLDPVGWLERKKASAPYLRHRRVESFS